MDDTTKKALLSLDLAPGASIDDVKKSYRELALIWHPDKVPDRVKDRATAKFTEINEAYQWLVRNPEKLRMSASSSSSSQRHSPPGYRTSTRTYQTQSERNRSEHARTGASSRRGSGASGQTGTGASSREGSGSSTDPAVQRVRQAARGIWTDARAGLYIFPDIDADRAANFVVSLQQNSRFRGVAATVNDLLVFYDIDGSGEEGMAITRSNHLVNNNTSTLYDIGDLAEVSLKEGFFFWSEILVRRRGTRQFELAGYAEKAPGRALANILKNLVSGGTHDA